MPTYAYHCRACDNDFEIKQQFSDDPLTDCIICETKDSVFRVIQPAGIVFKGSGWYVTDSRGSGGNGAKSSTASTASKNDTSENGSSSSDKSDTGTNGAASTESSDKPTKSSKPSTDTNSSSDGSDTKRAASA